MKSKAWPIVRESIRLQLYEQQPEGAGAVRPETVVEEQEGDDVQDDQGEPVWEAESWELSLKAFFDDEELSGKVVAFVQCTSLRMPVMMQARFVQLITQIMGSCGGKVVRLRKF